MSLCGGRQVKPAAKYGTIRKIRRGNSRPESAGKNMGNSGAVLIIGGGASGLAAALAAASGGARVCVLERLDRVGKKLLATGNGRCNLTNRGAAPEHYHSADPVQLARMLAQIPPQEVLDFFSAIGLMCDTQPDGRVYPYCYQASMVLDVLRAALDRAGVAVECGCEVTALERTPDGFCARTRDGRTFAAARVVLAAGGMAAPQFGTDGAGFALARAMGHHVESPYPCLVPLRCASFPTGLKGLRANGALTLYLGKKPVKTERGEVQFAEYGVSGIPAMQLSCLLDAGAWDAGVSMDFFPDLTFPALREMLEQRCASGDFATLETLLLGLLSKKLGYAVLKSCGLQPLSRASHALSRAQISTLAGALKGWRFAVTGTLPWAQAQVTGGGVPLGEVQAQTGASRLCPDLYLAGEVLDAAGDCGGFNLQWAWATGIAAGRAAARDCI